MLALHAPSCIQTIPYHPASPLHVRQTPRLILASHPYFLSLSPVFVHTVNLNPLPTFPTSHTPQTLHTVPLNLGKYLTPSNGQTTLASPAYIGVYDPPHSSNAVKLSKSISSASVGERSAAALVRRAYNNTSRLVSRKNTSEGWEGGY